MPDEEIEVDAGTRVIAHAVFTPEGSAVPADPGTVTARVRLPDDTIVTYTYGTDDEVVRDSAGTYHLAIDTADSGRYWVGIAGSGTGPVAAREVSFTVRPSAFSDAA